MKLKELLENDIDTLNRMLNDARKEYTKLEVELSTATLKDTSKMKKSRRKVAQIFTALNLKAQS